MSERKRLTLPKKSVPEAKARKPVDRPRKSAPIFSTTLKQDSLAYALLGAAEAVAKVQAGFSLPDALSTVFTSLEPTPQARGAIQDIAYRTMRQFGLAQALTGFLTSRMPESARLHGLLCSALSLLAEQELDYPDNKRYEPFTVVDQAVSAAASDQSISHGKGMVNAILRRFLREREALMKKASDLPSARWNYPDWWVAAMKAAYPQQWQAILEAGNQPPPLILRVNLRKTSVAAYLEMLNNSEIGATQVGPVAVKLERPLPVEQIPGFWEGLVSVQDAAAQLAAALLDIQEGMRVLDACAAPGGKTGHILEMAEVKLTSLEVDASRMRRVEENLARMGLKSSLVVGDAVNQQWWDGEQFDRILADVPCTASGVVRRHPDIRWLRRKSDAHHLATLSSKILDNLWQMLRPGGKLLFVTCSLWPQESEGQAAAFAMRHQAARLPAPGQLLPTSGRDQDHDGLFYALFQKLPLNTP